MEHRLTKVSEVMMTLAIIATAALVAGGGGAVAQGSGERLQIPLAAGDSLEVKFTAPFCAGDLEEGHVPQARVATPLIVSSIVIVKEETPVELRVEAADVEHNGRAGKPGRLKIVFVSVTATDSTVIRLDGDLDRTGKGRGILAKIFTLFLIKGQDPCVSQNEIFHPQIKEDLYVYPVKP